MKDSVNVGNSFMDGSMYHVISDDMWYATRGSSRLRSYGLVKLEDPEE
jgi:hypothetical protein